MSRFYSDLFDWKVDKQSMPGMDYWMIETTGQGVGHLNGGMFPKQGHETDRARFYIGVDDIDSHTQRFVDAGGAVLIEKQEVPGFGWAVIGSDPEGNVLGLFQPLQQMQQAAPARKSSTRKRSSLARSSSRTKKKNASSKKRRR